MQKRNPIYVLYALFGIVVFAMSAYLATRGSITGFELDIFRIINNLPDILRLLFVPAALAGTIAAVFLLAAYQVIRRQYLLALKVVLAGGGAWIIARLLKQTFVRYRPAELLPDVVLREVTDTIYGFPSGHVAVVTALVVVMSRYVSRRGQKGMTLLILSVALARLFLGVHAPLDIIGGYAVGLFIGSVINLIIGVPSRTVAPEVLQQLLRQQGLSVSDVRFLKADARGSVPYLATTPDGGVFIKLVGRENNVADWMFKVYRRIVYRRLEDETPFLSVKQELEHEAYASLLAHQGGIRTPQMYGVFRVDSTVWALVQQKVEGKTLAKLSEVELSDEVLKQCWQLVGELHSLRIVHRDLRAANVLRAPDGKVWLIDFGFASVAADTNGFIRDNVELLCSMSTLVGEKRALAAAAKVLKPDDFQAMLPYIQYAVLSGATTTSLKENRGLIDRIIQEAGKAAGRQKAPKAKLTRISRKLILNVIILLLALYVFLPQLGRFSSSSSALMESEIGFLLAATGASMATYLAAMIVYRSLAIVPLRFGRTLAVQVASSFTNRLLPAGIGGLGVNIRYLSKSGHTAAEASAVAAANNTIGFVCHMALLAAAFILAKRSFNELLSVSLPSYVYIVIPVVVLGLILFLWRSSKWRNRLKHGALEALHNLLAYRQQPIRLAVAMFGSFVVTLLYATCLYFSIRAVGLELTAVQTFLVFTLGAVGGAVTPTPGGLVGVEAGLLAGMIAFGLPEGPALTATLLYRFLTYWLPILPGFIAFKLLQSRKII